jgi:hypothetical protein
LISESSLFYTDKCFLDSNQDAPSFPRISERVKFYKENELGVNKMCEITEQFKAEGKTEATNSIIINMLNSDFPVEQIARLTNSTVDYVLKLKASRLLI